MTSAKLGEATDRWHAVRRFIRARLDRKSELGLRLTVNVILFGGRDLGVRRPARGSARQRDARRVGRAHQRVGARARDGGRPPILPRRHARRLARRVGDHVAVRGLAALATASASCSGRGSRATSAAASLQLVLKTTIHRDRPQYAAAYLHGQSYSFPSGHTMSATICWSLMVVCAGLSLGWHGATPSATLRRLDDDHPADRLQPTLPRRALPERRTRRPHHRHGVGRALHDGDPHRGQRRSRTRAGDVQRLSGDGERVRR